MSNPTSHGDAYVNVGFPGVSADSTFRSESRKGSKQSVQFDDRMETPRLQGGTERQPESLSVQLSPTSAGSCSQRGVKKDIPGVVQSEDGAVYATSVQRTAMSSVHTHSFRDRDRSKEHGERAFGVYYEQEKDRVQRVEAVNNGRYLKRDPWLGGQSSPPHLAPVKASKSGSHFPVKRFLDGVPQLLDGIGDYIISDIRLPYVPEPACRNFRETKRPKPSSHGRHKLKRLDHDLKSTIGISKTGIGSARGAWQAQAPPLATVEPYIDGTKFAGNGPAQWSRRTC